MAWVERLITRTTQPQDAVGIDWNNPNSDGLALLVDHRGLAIFDAAVELITQTGTVSRTVTSNGLALGSAATGSLLSNTRNFVAPTNTAFSVVGTIAIGNTAQTNRYLAIARDNAGVGNQVALIYGYVAGKLEFFAPQRTGTDPRASSGITINDSKPHTFGYSYDGLNWIGYLDGVRVFSTTLTFNCNIGSNLKGSLLSALALNTLDGAVLSWATFDQGVGDARLKSLTANPYQLLEPEVQRIWIDDATEAAPPGTTTVTTDASASYTVAGSVQADGAAAYAVRSSATADAAASYKITGAVQQDAPAQYAIRAAVTADASGSYSLIAATSVTADASASYAVRGAVQQDASASYAVRAAVFADAVASYALIVDGQVTADASGSYQIRGAVQSDVSLAYEIAGAVQASVAGGYAVQAAVSADAAAGYFVDGVVASGVYPSQTTVLAGVQYGPTGVEYTGMLTIGGSGPTAAEIVAAVLAALQATAIPVNMTQVKGQPINGAGSEADPWGP